MPRVILKAKQEKFIPAVIPLMNQMTRNGFYISQQVFDFVKNVAGE